MLGLRRSEDKGCALGLGRGFPVPQLPASSHVGLCALDAPLTQGCASGFLQMLRAQALIRSSPFFKLIHFAQNSKTTKMCKLLVPKGGWAGQYLKP